MPPIPSFPIGTPYNGPIRISIDDAASDEASDSRSRGKGIVVHMYTKNLHLRSVQAQDVDNYFALFNDEEVVANFADGNKWTKEKAVARVNGWVDRWQSCYPFSAFAIFKRSLDSGASGAKDETFLGHIVAGSGECKGYGGLGKQEGYSEIAGIGHKEYYRHGYAHEAAAALIKSAIPAYQEKGYNVETFFVRDDKTCTKKSLPLSWITATAAPENIASIKVLTGLGFECKQQIFNQDNRSGGTRYCFALKV